MYSSYRYRKYGRRRYGVNSSYGPRTGYRQGWKNSKGGFEHYYKVNYFTYTAREIIDIAQRFKRVVFVFNEGGKYAKLMFTGGDPAFLSFPGDYHRFSANDPDQVSEAVESFGNYMRPYGY